MQEGNPDKGTERGSSVRSGLLARIRNRTEREQEGTSYSASDSPYSAAALGQVPYVAMGNGVIVVERRCSNWNC
jgi:hypothetical protein